MNKKKLIISIIVLLIDQITKYIVSIFGINKTIIKNLFSINYVQNDGAAFNLLSGKSISLIVLSMILLVLVYNLMFSFKESKTNDIAFGLLLGGILGNLIDRALFQYVRDFIEIKLFNFPVFNIADMCIVIGIFIIIILTVLEGDIYEVRSKRNRRTNKNR